MEARSKKPAMRGLAGRRNRAALNLSEQFNDTIWDEAK
jgi:hypothetical protein